MFEHVHVYPLAEDADDIQRLGYGPDEVVVSAPMGECALCKVGLCEQTLEWDPNEECGVVLHAKPVAH